MIAASASARAVAIVPVFEGGELLSDCVDALAASRPHAPRIVLVANGDGDGACAAAAARFPGRVEVVRPCANLGFAGGVNRGVAHALSPVGIGGDAPRVVVLVNQDCVVEPGAVAALAAAVDDPGVGIVGAYLFEADGRTLQHAGGVVHANGLTDHVGRGRRDAPASTGGPARLDYVTGALCAFRSEIWRRFGPLDAGYFPAYYEEVDWCRRLAGAGLRIVCEPGARAVHAEASASGRGSRRFRARYHRSRMRFVARHLLRPGRAAAACKAEAVWLARQRSVSDLLPALRAYAALPAELRARPRVRQDLSQDLRQDLRDAAGARR